MKTKIISIALAVVTMLSAVALFSGCSDGEYPVEVANITIESQPKNIVVLDAPTADILIATGYDRYIVKEAVGYIKNSTKDYTARDMFVSFSGGKDSTVTSDLVMRALSEPKILHIFGDTTLEFPETMKYIERFKKEHPQTPVVSSRNKDKDFEELCALVGPPSRVMRWCCTIFKTGAIQRKIKTMFRNKNKIITFYGIRRNESAANSCIP